MQKLFTVWWQLSKVTLFLAMINWAAPDVLSFESCPPSTPTWFILLQYYLIFRWIDTVHRFIFLNLYTSPAKNLSNAPSTDHWHVLQFVVFSVTTWNQAAALQHQSVSDESLVYSPGLTWTCVTEQRTPFLYQDLRAVVLGCFFSTAFEHQNCAKQIQNTPAAQLKWSLWDYSLCHLSEK